MGEDKKTELEAKLEELEKQLDSAKDVRTQNIIMRLINDAQREFHEIDK
jgi:hypothetical protein